MMGLKKEAVVGLIRSGSDNGVEEKGGGVGDWRVILVAVMVLVIELEGDIGDQMTNTMVWWW